MIAIFLSKEEAQKFADKCHEFLQANCKNYSATCWQVPVSDKEGKQFYVKIPQEYYKEYYKDSEKIIPFVDAEIKKASKLQPKPDAIFDSLRQDTILDEVIEQP